MNKALIFTVFIVIFGALLFFLLRDRTVFAPAGDSEVSIQGASNGPSYRVAEKNVPVDAFSEEPRQSEANVTKAIVDQLLTTKQGHMTKPEARRLFDDLIKRSDLSEAVGEYLASDSVPHRLFAVYALMSGNGYDEAIRNAALHDPSHYVRAEIAGWLLNNQEFDSADALARKIVGSLSASEINLLIQSTASHQRMEFPGSISRLELGEQLQRYLALLAAHSSNVVSRIALSMRNDSLTPNGKKAMILALAAANPPDYFDIMWNQLEIEPELMTRAILARHLAAKVSGTNMQVLAEIRMMLRDPGMAGRSIRVEPREVQLSELRKIEAMLNDLFEDPDANLVVLPDATGRFNDLARRIGYDTVDSNTISNGRKFLSRYSHMNEFGPLAEVIYGYKSVNSSK